MPRGTKPPQLIVHQRHKSHAPRKISRQLEPWQRYQDVLGHVTRDLSFNGAFVGTLKWDSRACRASIDNHPFHVFLADKLQRLIDDFSPIEDPHEKLAAVVDRAKRIPSVQPEERIDANHVPGCVSVVWLVAVQREG